METHDGSPVRRAILASCLGAATVLAAPAGAAAIIDQGVAERVSVSTGEAQATHASYGGAVSADGRFVAFASSASNLVRGDTNNNIDVFVRDLQAGTTERVSVRSSGAQVRGDYETRYIAIAPGGRFVAFTTWAPLVRGDRNGIDDVYIHDRQTDRTERVSVTSDEQGRSGCEGCSTGLGVSGGGRYVAFNTDKRLTRNAVGSQLFVRDRVAGTTRLVSVNDRGAVDNGIAARGANITPDGRYVTWESDANNLVAGDDNDTYDVFVRDLVEGHTERVSVASDGQQANDYSGANEVQLSRDGRYVLFASNATNLVPGDTNGEVDLFVRDRLGGATERVTVSSAGDEADASTWSDGEFSISGDGRYVAYASSASTLVAADTNGTSDVFVRDRSSHETVRISHTPEGEELGAGAWGGEISADASLVAFMSGGSRVVPGDTNRRVDVFAYHLMFSAGD